MNIKKIEEGKTERIRNCSIDLFRYICAVLVVAIHTNPISDINGKLGYLCTQILPRIGVPFFFAVAGFYYIQKLETGKPVFLSYMKKLLGVYFIWSLLYAVLDYLQYHPEDMGAFVKDCIRRILITGISEHFWFFPALIISVCITTLCFKLGIQKLLYTASLLLYAVGCFGCSYYKLGMSLPILAELYSHPQFLQIRRILMMGLPFFLAGYLVYQIKDWALEEMREKWILHWWIVSVILWLAEIAVVRLLRWEVNIYITFGLYLLLITTLLLLLKNPLPQYRSAADCCRLLANVTYYSHPLVILALTTFYNHVLGLPLRETPKFLLTVGITLAGGLIYRYWSSKWKNRNSFFFNKTFR